MVSFAPDHLNIAAWPGRQPDCSHPGDLDGESLEAVLQAGPIVFSRLLDIAVHTAEDLSLYHATGSAHGGLTARDIMLARNGAVKVLFRNPFPKGSPQDDQLALGRILLAAVPLTMRIPDSFRAVIARLLAPDPEDRYSSTRDLYLDLRAICFRLAETPDILSASPTVPRTSVVPRPFLALPAAALVFSVLVFYLLNHSALPKRGQTDIQSFPSWSPGGEAILFVKTVAGIDQVFVQNRASAAPVQLTHSVRRSLNPRWSADGKSIEFQNSGRWQTLRLP